jgi:WRKY transcription factor 2
MDTQLDIPEQAGPQVGAVNDSVWAGTQKGTAAGTPDWRNDNVEVSSSASGGLGPEFGNPSSSVQGQSGTPFESADAVDASSTFSNDEDDDRATHGSVGYDGEGEESESKRRFPLHFSVSQCIPVTFYDIFIGTRCTHVV